MRYYLGCLIREEAEKYYKEIVEDISSRFNLEKLIQKSRPPHITIKSPFEIDGINEIKSTMKRFCDNQRPLYFNVKGFGNFGKELIYINLLATPQIKKNLKKLLEELRTNPEISWSKYDNENKVFHITIVKNEELENRFNEIWNYLSPMEQLKSVSFDNITIFKKISGKTYVHRMFEFNPNL
jgi:2'-5' RNA ligase